jgi:3-deoxy-D-arabino-heptulosonate 7-phosphate (DAHP) synthase
LGRLLNDSRFSVLLEAHVGFKMHTTGEYQVALDAIDAILAEIDASLAQH